MKEQNLGNHTRVVPSYHLVTTPLALLLLIGSIVNLVKSYPEQWLQPALLVLASVVIVSCVLHSRMFALRAQDRAIRAEENLRHYVLTGKPLHPDTRMGQVIALRFASDQEFPVLAEKAIKEGLRNREIKKAIKQWKADYYRV
ncbi:MAG: DUF6526 family protein [Chitinophagaceae bacterium]